MRQSKGYTAGDKACLLCLDEKLENFGKLKKSETN